MKMAEIIRLHGRKKNSSRDHTPYAIIVKPRKDLKIEYPCEVRIENRAIIVMKNSKIVIVIEIVIDKEYEMMPH